MRKKDLIIGLGVGLTVIAGTGALANPQGIDVAEARERAAQTFTDVDANGDGLVSAEEFAGAERPARGMRMRGHEFGNRGPRGAKPGARMHRRPGFEGPEGGAERRQELEAEAFAAVDTDGDGSVSESEYAARHESMKKHRQAKMFTRLDANDSGYLEADEFPPEAGHLEQLDTDGDGIVTREEMRAGARERRERELKSS